MIKREMVERRSSFRSVGVVLTMLVVVPAFAWTPVRAEILLHPTGWRFPNTQTADKEAIRVSDKTPLIPGRETVRRGYRKRDGTYFQTYEIEGRVFGVEFDTDGKPPFEYSIMDTDGDGKFESKIMHTKGNKDRAYVPQWIIDYYYEMHPEQENPTARNGETAPEESPGPEAEGGEEAEDDAPPPEVRDRPNP